MWCVCGVCLVCGVFGVCLVCDVCVVNVWCVCLVCGVCVCVVCVCGVCMWCVWCVCGVCSVCVCCVCGVSLTVTRCNNNPLRGKSQTNKLTNKQQTLTFRMNLQQPHKSCTFYIYHFPPVLPSGHSISIKRVEAAITLRNKYI